jgi:hypothetical protein
MKKVAREELATTMEEIEEEEERNSIGREGE